MLLATSQCSGFTLSPGRGYFAFATSREQNSRRLYAADGGLDDDSNNAFGGDNSTIVTREMFQREMLKDPVVKRKKGKNGSSYKVLDNRDSLPFTVEHVTPDPYTHPDTKKKRAQKNSRKLPKRPGGAVEDGLTPSSLYMGGENGNNDDKTKIGEFLLDKMTTTGDLIEIGEIQYRVTRHKCQYKYAGGKRFVMVKKVLQVKEVGRVLQEEYLLRQWENSADT